MQAGGTAGASAEAVKKGVAEAAARKEE
jgi:hypothetical protein